MLQYTINCPYALICLDKIREKVLEKALSSASITVSVPEIRLISGGSLKGPSLSERRLGFEPNHRYGLFPAVFSFFFFLVFFFLDVALFVADWVVVGVNVLMLSHAAFLST